MRLIDPTIPESEAGNKIPATCNEVFKKYKETADNKGAQVVFLDLGTPSRKTKNKNENEDENDSEDSLAISKLDEALYGIIKKSLIKRGIPANEIAFAHDAKNREQLEKIFKKVNSGEIRVLIGSTEKIGVGANFHKRLAAAHHLDCPWRPRDIEQREGRILRAGNMYDEVEIFVYATEDSGDLYMYDQLRDKGEMIHKFFKGDITENELMDVSPVVLNADEIVAISSSTPEIHEKAMVRDALNKLRRAQKAYMQQRNEHERVKAELEKEIPQLEYRIKNLRADIKNKIETKGDAFKMKIGDTVYEKRTDATAALEKLTKKFTETSLTKIGEIGGFDVMAHTILVYATKNGVEELTQKNVELKLKNNGVYTVKDSIQSMERFISDGIEKTLSDVEKILAQDKERLAETEKQLKKPFAKQADLDFAEKKLAEIDAKITGKGLKVSEDDIDEGKKRDTEKLLKEIERDKDSATAKRINGNFDERNSAMLEAVNKATGWNLRLQEKNYELPVVDFGMKSLLENIWFAHWKAENLNDAIKAARYLSKNFSAEISKERGVDFIAVYDESGEVFSINETGGE